MDSLSFMLFVEEEIGRGSLLRIIHDYMAHVESDGQEKPPKKEKHVRILAPTEPQPPPPLTLLSARDPQQYAHEVAKNLAAEVASFSPVSSPKHPCSYCNTTLYQRKHMREAKRIIIHDGKVLGDRYYCSETCESYREAILMKRMAVEKEERRLREQVYFHKKWYGQ